MTFSIGRINMMYGATSGMSEWNGQDLMIRNGRESSSSERQFRSVTKAKDERSGSQDNRTRAKDFRTGTGGSRLPGIAERIRRCFERVGSVVRAFVRRAMRRKEVKVGICIPTV